VGCLFFKKIMEKGGEVMSATLLKRVSSFREAKAFPNQEVCVSLPDFLEDAGPTKAMPKLMPNHVHNAMRHLGREAGVRGLSGEDYEALYNAIYEHLDCVDAYCRKPR
jgi:hypothetical protein